MYVLVGGECPGKQHLRGSLYIEWVCMGEGWSVYTLRGLLLFVCNKWYCVYPVVKGPLVG